MTDTFSAAKVSKLLAINNCAITPGGSVYIEKLFATFADHGAKVGTDNVNVDVKGNVAQGDFANLGVGKNQQGEYYVIMKKLAFSNL